LTKVLAVTVYTPESPLREPGKLFRAMFSDLLASRELAWRLFVRDTSAQYRQSILGYLWAFLPSLVTTATFTYLNSQKILNIGDTVIPYPAFVMIGMVLWQTFLDALNSPLKAVAGARGMLTKINFPREALILGGVADVLFNFLVRAIILLPIFLYYRLAIGSSFLLVPVAALALLVLGLSVGMLLVPLGVLYTDVARAVGLVASFWMLLTPVVYPPPASGVGAFLSKWNPVSPVLLTGRQWLISQPATEVSAFIVVTVVSVVVLVFGWIMFRLALPHLIDRIGN
jgi:lipopolysaccharide transport system permease protein